MGFSPLEIDMVWTNDSSSKGTKVIRCKRSFLEAQNTHDLGTWTLVGAALHPKPRILSTDQTVDDCLAGALAEFVGQLHRKGQEGWRRGNNNMVISINWGLGVSITRDLLLRVITTAPDFLKSPTWTRLIQLKCEIPEM